MSKNYFRYYKPEFLIAFIIVLGTILTYATKKLLPLINGYLDEPYIQFPSISILIGLIFILIDKFLWNTKMFSWLFWVEDFSGKYEGKIEYQFMDKNKHLKKGEKRQLKIIKQTGSEIVISTYTYDEDRKLSSPSVNSSMYVEKTKGNDEYNIIYNYLNEGSPLKKKVNTHYGTEILKFKNVRKEKSISGRYFTERDPYQSKGLLTDFKWIEKV